MKVCVFAAYFYPHVGGYEKNIHELAKRFVAVNHKVRVVTCNIGNYPEFEYVDGIEVLRLPSWNVGSVFPLPKPSISLLRIFVGKPDVVLTQTRFFPTSLLGTFYAFILGCHHIHVERGTCHSVVASKPLAMAIRTYDHTLGSLVVHMARANVGVSQAACDFVGHLGGKNRRVIWNGVTND